MILLSSTLARTREILGSITKDDDGAHVIDLIRLLKMSGAENNDIGDEAMKELYMQTEDFDKHYQDFINRL